MIQVGEECSVDMLYTLCNRIYQEKKCQAEWGKVIIILIHKKKDKTNCKNYRGISLMSVPGKIYTKILQECLRRYVEEVVGEEQAGFGRGRGTMDQIFVIRQLRNTSLRIEFCITTSSLLGRLLIAFGSRVW